MKLHATFKNWLRSRDQKRADALKKLEIFRGLFAPGSVPHAIADDLYKAFRELRNTKI